jgi:hypothetical protein
VLPDGRTAFNLIQNAADTGQGSLVYFLFDLLLLDGENMRELPLLDRKARLDAFVVGAPKSLRYNDHQIGQGAAFHRLACEHGLEGIVSKRIDGRYEPDRRTWLKTKCLNREEFVVGWSDPEGSRHRIGALLLGYYTPDGQLIYAGRVGTGMPDAELERLWQDDRSDPARPWRDQYPKFLSSGGGAATHRGVVRGNHLHSRDRRYRAPRSSHKSSSPRRTAPVTAEPLPVALFGSHRLVRSNTVQLI